MDAGGKGLTIIFGAMLHTFKTGEIVENEAEKEESAVTVETFAATVGKFDEEITYTYCTEMLITKKKDCADHSKLRAYLETIGDCVVVVEDDDVGDVSSSVVALEFYVAPHIGAVSAAAAAVKTRIIPAVGAGAGTSGQGVFTDNQHERLRVGKPVLQRSLDRTVEARIPRLPKRMRVKEME